MTDRFLFPQRLNLRAFPGQMAREYANRAAALMALPFLVEIDRATYPDIEPGRLLAARLDEVDDAEVRALVADCWPDLASVTDQQVTEVLEVINDRADELMGAAMTAARGNGVLDVAA